MPEQPDRTDRPVPARGGAKHIYLSDEGRAAVQAWADGEGVSFSAAIETLARLGLREDPRDAWSPALTAKIIGAVRADLGPTAGCSPPPPWTAARPSSLR